MKTSTTFSPVTGMRPDRLILAEDWPELDVMNACASKNPAGLE